MKDKKDHNEQDIRNIAPVLFAIKKTGEFVVPEEFFDSLNEEINLKLKGLSSEEFKTPAGYFDSLHGSIMKEVQNPSSSSFEDDSGLDIPKDYFKDLHGSIMGEVKQTEVESEQRSSKSLLIRWVSASAIAASFILGVWLISISDKECETFACLLEQTELEQEDLMFLETEDLELIINDSITFESTIDEIDDEMLDYLLEEGLDDWELEEVLEYNESN